MQSANQEKSIKAHPHRRLICLFNFFKHLNIVLAESSLKDVYFLSLYDNGLMLSPSLCICKPHTGEKSKFEMHVKVHFRNPGLYF